MQQSQSRRRIRTLTHAEVEAAFSEAQDVLGDGWQIMGRGHCRRVTLKAQFSAAARRGAWRCWFTSGRNSWGFVYRYVPLAIVEKAAEILGVAPALLISGER